MVAGISSDAYVGLIGVGIGFVFGFGGDLVRAEIHARTNRKVAALLVYGELTSNLAAVSALRKFGVWSGERIHRSAWEAHGRDLLFRGDENRVGRIVMAYNAGEDVGFMSSEPGTDYTQGSDADFLDRMIVPFMYEGLREAGRLGGIPKEEVEDRIANSRRLMLGPSE